MPIQIYQIDAFASVPFSGNPACVCLIEQDMPDSWMQSVAAEMNLSETAFVWRRGNAFPLRWFTPLSEVELCGHATLATFHALVQSGWIEAGSEATFETLSGQLMASSDGEKIHLDFPSKPPLVIQPPVGLIESLGVEAGFVGTDKIDFILELENEEAVRSVQPDFERLKKVDARGVIVTATSDDSSVDIVSRFFGPRVGINEDPVTGSAHCLLAPYWCQKLGKESLVAYQASKRGGYLDISLRNERVRLGGRAHTVFRGELLG